MGEYEAGGSRHERWFAWADWLLMSSRIDHHEGIPVLCLFSEIVLESYYSLVS